MNSTWENTYLKFWQLASTGQCFSHNKSTISLETLRTTSSENHNASHYYFLVRLHCLWGHRPISWLPVREPRLVEWYDVRKGVTIHHVTSLEMDTRLLSKEIQELSPNNLTIFFNKDTWNRDASLTRMLFHIPNRHMVSSKHIYYSIRFLKYIFQKISFLIN